MIQARLHAPWAEELTAVWHGQQPRLPRDPDRRSKGLGVTSTFVVGQPEPDDATTDILPCQSGQRTGIQRMPRPAGGDEDTDADPAVSRGVVDRVQDQV